MMLKRPGLPCLRPPRSAAKKSQGRGGCRWRGSAADRLCASAKRKRMLSTVLLAVLCVLRNMTLVTEAHQPGPRVGWGKSARPVGWDPRCLAGEIPAPLLLEPEARKASAPPRFPDPHSLSWQHRSPARHCAPHLRPRPLAVSFQRWHHLPSALQAASPGPAPLCFPTSCLALPCNLWGHGQQCLAGPSHAEMGWTLPGKTGRWCSLL